MLVGIFNRHSFSLATFKGCQHNIVEHTRPLTYLELVLNITKYYIIEVEQHNKTTNFSMHFQLLSPKNVSVGLNAMSKTVPSTHAYAHTSTCTLFSKITLDFK